MQSWQCPPSAVTVPQLALDPYRFPGAPDTVDSAPGDVPCNANGQPPFGEVDAQTHLAWPLQPSDRRRLDLHAALTTAGVPPTPGDLEAIRTLSALDDTTSAALVRWITAHL
ncbi:hypothetical protein PV721_30710 [Streptomyces sp. MB09-01]|uniref:hypothetical protein n=1 Tax=Streptomyces sp. MB09-01 TaxID=3028666 RepID=UPI0029BB78B0|nr:hypothetical protein [Streptomyces sp. MB09-01]MDX3538638.1 hypothetical protein [Streptomyces sp. MB09-01]